MAESDDDKPLSQDDMRLWLNREVLMVTRAAQLQIMDATDFVTAYLAGKLSPEQAEERLHRYSGRWGEANLELTMDQETTKKQEMADKNILTRLDAQRQEEKKSWGDSMSRLRDLTGKHQRGS